MMSVRCAMMTFGSRDIKQRDETNMKEKKVAAIVLFYIRNGNDE